MIDIVVPVYAGEDETRKCIASILASRCDTPHEVVVIDDCSPLPSLSTWLEDEAVAGRIRLLRNAANLGFVASVNRAMALHPRRDVVLLNSDTEVAGDWLDRMVRCAASAPDVATVTPFSNNATLASFPFPFVANPLPRGWTTERLDRVFSSLNAGQSVEIPTGVGFCMFIKRACLDAVGMFDEAAFGHGYGEENDFCRRAVRHGWRNLLCADVFVFHSGGVSFGTSAAARQAHALAILTDRFPEYESLVASFRKTDPIAPLREPVADAVLRDSLAQSCRNDGAVLHVLGVGGGAARYVRELCELTSASAQRPQHFLLFIGGGAIAVLEDTRTGWRYPLPLAGAHEPGRKALDDAVRALNVRTVHLHTLSPAALALLPRFETAACRLVVTLHDIGFLWHNAFADWTKSVPDDADRAWRRALEAHLDRAAVILAPSRYIAAAFSDAFPALPRPQVFEPVQHHFDAPAALPDKLTDRIEESLARAGFAHVQHRVALVGALGTHKGLDYWRQLREVAHRTDPARIGWVLIGYGDELLYPHAGADLIVHGVFEPHELGGLLRAYGVDLVYFPLGMPEAHCFALSDVWMAGWPAVVHDHGALGERLRAHPEGGWLLPAQSTPQQAFEAIADILANRPSRHAVAECAKVPARDRVCHDGNTRAMIEEIWMNEQSDRTRPDEMTIAAFQQHIRPVVDDACFRAELRKASDDHVFLTQQNEALRQTVEELRALASERERWAGKLERDIAELRGAIAQLTSEKSALEERLALALAQRTGVVARLVRGFEALGRRLRGR